MIVEFLEITFSRHDTCKLLCDTSLALARSSPTRRYTGCIIADEAAVLRGIHRCRNRGGGDGRAMAHPLFGVGGPVKVSGPSTF